MLNACETARAAQDNAFSSVAGSLMRTGMPAVPAMQYPISDPAAVEFGHAFYESLAEHAPRGRRGDGGPPSPQTRPARHAGVGHTGALPALARLHHRSPVRPHHLPPKAGAASHEAEVPGSCSSWRRAGEREAGRGDLSSHGCPGCCPP
ncbi:CHAT domain-containing protein [Nonomuraea insulae]|uniref:CHAT domain-containing protein n=1 Tax=Nonomuraea insulae TaxID=1616787 RepID=A0ABW1D7N3_9ACTN